MTLSLYILNIQNASKLLSLSRGGWKMAGQRIQQGRGLKQVVVRFNVEQDAALLEWLAPFADTYDMTKVIRLACYMLAGIDPAEGLLGLLPAVKKQQNGSGRSTPPVTAPQPTHDTLANVMQELAALRAAVLDRQILAGDAHRSATSTDSGREYREEEFDTANLSASGGLDITSRRRGGPARPSSNGWHPPQQPDFDPEASSRLLFRTIRDFSTNLQRGQR